MRKSLHAAAPFLLLCGVATCADEGAAVLDRHHAHADAGVASVDATPTPGQGGSVTCYLEANPAQTCTAPAHCCFSNYSAAHDGTCTTATCAYGTIACDGPEDCA